MSSHAGSRGDTNGIVLLDKPKGVTSNSALQEAKRLLNARKAGHTGSLDPIATGLLPLCFGQATKVSGFFLEADKRYWVQLKLGVSTDSGDADGATIETRLVRVTAAEVAAALRDFEGQIEQVPPMYSAIKHEGQPLYKLARQGIEIERKPRLVTVRQLLFRGLDGDILEFEIDCSHGFYVRALANDLGEALGCGAHVAALRRLAVGSFHIDDAITLEELRERHDAGGLDEVLIPGDQGLAHIPEVMLSADAAYYLCRGQAVRAQDLPSSGWVRLYSAGAGFLGLGTVLEDGRVAPKRLFHAT